MVAQSIAINLKRLRSAKGFSQGKIAGMAGLSRLAYANIESGKANPRVNNLQQIADVLSVGIQDLVTQVPKIDSLRFRCKKMPTGREKSRRDQIVADVAFWLRDYSDLEARLVKQRQTVLKDIKSTDPKDVAAKVRKVLNLKDDEPINDICGLVEHAGVKIKFVESDLEGFFGLSAFDKNGFPAIVVNVKDGISVERQIFTVAHELGHVVMHHGSFRADAMVESDKEEKEADQFAGYFLMPKEAFYKSWQENKGLHWLRSILHIKRIYKVSYKTVIHRLVDEGVDSKIWRDFPAEYRRQYGEDLKDHKEPRPLDPLDFVEDRLSALTREALDKELISVGRGAEILGIGVEDMRERIASWGLVHDSI